jgi:hypothetical protein
LNPVTEYFNLAPVGELSRPSKQTETVPPASGFSVTLIGPIIASRQSLRLFELFELFDLFELFELFELFKRLR